MLVETQRLIITDLTVDMCHIFQKNSVDDDNRRFVPDEVFETIEDTNRTIEWLIKSYQCEKGPFLYPVLLKDKTNIGYVQACAIEEGWELGYHIAKKYTGHGYATEAVNAFLPVIMQQLKTNVIYGIVLEENIASHKVLEKCNFKLDFMGIDKYQGVDKALRRYILTSVKKDSSTESWGRIEMTNEWIRLAQTNPHRIHFIMPFTFKQLGDVSGKVILDLGCGEGGYSRELTRKGAIVTAVDCAENAIKYCASRAEDEQLKITYHVRNSCDLYDIADDTFDTVLSSMMLMDCEDFEGTVKEIKRVLKPGGKLFASVCHPCFHYGGGIGRQDKGIDKKVVVSNYYHPTEWEAPLSSGCEKVIWRHRTIQDYVKTFIKCGLTITDLNEPIPTDEQAAITVDIAWMQKIPIFLFWELRKQANILA